MFWGNLVFVGISSFGDEYFVHDVLPCLFTHAIIHLKPSLSYSTELSTYPPVTEPHCPVAKLAARLHNILLSHE